MKKRLWFAGSFAFVALWAWVGLEACGDKFLTPGLGASFQRTPAERQQASVLVYAPASSALSASLKAYKVDAAIRKAGYRPTQASTLAEVDHALRQGGVDVVVVDLADGDAIRSRSPHENGPVVLPVADRLTGVQLKQARKEFQTVLKSPGRSQDFLDAIDDALAIRVEALAKAAKKTR